MNAAPTRRRASRSLGSPQRTHPTPEEIAALWQRHRRGCSQARAALITRYQHLPTLTVGRFLGLLPFSIDGDDLLGEGYLGLIKAVDRYDPARGIKFETYAITLIRGAILEALRETDWVPRLVRDQVKRVEKACTAFETTHQRLPDSDELAEALGCSEVVLQKMLQAIGQINVASLDATLQDHAGEAVILGDLLPDSQPLPDTTAMQHETIAELWKAIDWLPDREQQILRLYYQADQTFKQIGKQLDISESRVYQLHYQALSRLRICLPDGITSTPLSH